MGINALETQRKNLSLTEEELAPIKVDKDPLEEDEVKSRKSLLGKLCSNRSIGKEVIQTTMGKIWKICRKVIFKEMSQNLFMITFATEQTKPRS